MSGPQALRIPMRDGVSLAADLCLPDRQAESGAGYPVILERTPYGKSKVSRSESSLRNPQPKTRTEVAKYFADHGYAVVMQDCRGRYDSEGDFHKYVNEAEDGYDTVDWIRHQDWCNGHIGTMGLSYGAHTQFALAALSPPGLACMFVDSGGFSNAYQSGIRQGGAFELKQVTWALRHALLSRRTAEDPIRRRRLEAVDIAEWMRRTDWTPGNSALAAAPEFEAYLFEQWGNGNWSEYWEQPALCAERHYTAFPDVPTAILGSWYDPYAAAAVMHFNSLSALHESPVKLLMGPWTHGDRSQRWAGDVDFGERSTLDDNIADDYLALRLAWFDEHLRSKPTIRPALRSPVTYFRMGGGDGAMGGDGRLQHNGEWLSSETWPPAQCVEKSWYLTANGSLKEAKPDTNASLTFRYDPNDPVPTMGGAVTSGKPLMVGGAFEQVQRPDTFSVVEIDSDRPLADRPDVLVFESEPLESDLEVSGPIIVELFVSSDKSDTDFTVKLLDVYPPSEDLPDGYAMNLSDSIFRMRYRESWEEECMMTPGKIYRVSIHAADTSNLFRAGHKIRLDISSSNYPRFDINPNTGKQIGNLSHPQAAQNSVFCGGITPSRVTLSVNQSTQSNAIY